MRLLVRITVARSEEKYGFSGEFAIIAFLIIYHSRRKDR
jgi:hypothetical protein